MKRALLVGINEYSQPQFNLKGCINDISATQALLTSQYGYTGPSIKVITDRDATRNNLLIELRALVTGLSDGDEAVFYFAGHGTQKGNGDPGEEDGKNEAIVPFDSTYDSLITDDELSSIISSGVGTPRIKFSAIYDCCHSGTMVRALSIFGTNFDIVTNRCINISDLAELPFAPRAANFAPYSVLSACKDEQTAADLKIEGISRGAFSFALHEVLKSNSSAVIDQIGASVLAAIKRVSKHPQEPQYYKASASARVFG